MIRIGPFSGHVDWRSEFQRLDGAYAPSTMKSYFTDVEVFETWCRQAGREPFPADPNTVREFLDAQSKIRAPSTVRRRLYAIRRAHRLVGVPDPTLTEDVHLAIRRARRTSLARPKQARGLTSEYLELFLSG